MWFDFLSSVLSLVHLSFPALPFPHSINSFLICSCISHKLFRRNKPLGCFLCHLFVNKLCTLFYVFLCELWKIFGLCSEIFAKNGKVDHLLEASSVQETCMKLSKMTTVIDYEHYGQTGRQPKQTYRKTGRQTDKRLTNKRDRQTRETDRQERQTDKRDWQTRETDRQERQTRETDRWKTHWQTR